MGTTTIKRIENRSSSSLLVLSRKNPNSRGANIVIAPGGSIAADMEIPRAPGSQDFFENHLEIQESGQTRYWIWQAANADGDFIRFSTDGLWHNQGEKVHGYPGVAKNIFEAVGSAVLTGKLQPLGDVLLGERALVVLDSHFEIIPIAPKPLQFPFTNIKRIENKSSRRLVLFDREKNHTSPIVLPSGTADVNMTIPWAPTLAEFAWKRLEVKFDGQTRYWIWQADNELDGDYIRFATTEAWSPTATRVHGISATGITPADLVFTADRSLIVRDSGIEVWPHPLLIDDLLSRIKPLLPKARIVGQTALRPSSVPKKSAVAFSIAGPASDAFKRGEREARYLYNDSGKRYEFTINSAGTIVAKDPAGKSTLVDSVWSYTDSRLGKSAMRPSFDLIAASNGRLVAKAKDRNDFYIAALDHMFIHLPKESPEHEREILIPSYAFKLDPQFGTGSDPSELLASTNNVVTDSPMSERLPIFRRIMQEELLDMMIARQKPGELELIDSRPPQNVIGLAMRDLAVSILPVALAAGFALFNPALLATLAPLELITIFTLGLSEALRRNVELGSAPPDRIPTYRPVTYERPDGTRISPPAIAFDEVLDIGVSHVHWYQQYQLSSGGEIQPMLLSEFLQGVYRFFNGPVQDGDGFIDGTCNVYALVKHKTSKYSLLFQDEQWYFTQRWRLVDPDDKKGLATALITDLSNPDYEWNAKKYWCPFRNGHINDNSRLAVAGFVVLVTGSDPDEDAPRIYSINFSFNSMDRTWRYRDLPCKAAYFDQEMIETGNETIQAHDKCVYPQTIRLREDLTLHLKGANKIAARFVAGRWYQRYLPADNSLVPPKDQLLEGSMPKAGYTHAWKFLPEDTFLLADKFSHFGVYDSVDSRCQYYDVTPVSGGDETTLESGGEGPWVDDAHQLYVSQWKFRYDVQRPGIDPIDPPSLFNADTRLRIVRRGARWIAMHWDKRDDDLIPFERLPMRVTLKNRGRKVQVMIGPHHRVLQAPMVRDASVWLEPDGTAGISFEPIASTTSYPVRDAVWRVRMAALEAVEDRFGRTTRARVVPIFNFIMERAFTSRSNRYERRWSPTDSEMKLLRHYCSEEGAMRFATSIWFEDIVGHVSVPDSVVWHQPQLGAAHQPNVPAVDRSITALRKARSLSLPSDSRKSLATSVRPNRWRPSTSALPTLRRYRTRFPASKPTNSQSPLATAALSERSTNKPD